MSRDGLKEHPVHLSRVADVMKNLPMVPQPAVTRDAVQQVDLDGSTGTVRPWERTRGSPVEQPPPTTTPQAIPASRAKEGSEMEATLLGNLSRFDYSDDEEDGARSADGGSNHARSVRRKRSTTTTASSEIKVALRFLALYPEPSKTTRPTVVTVPPLPLASASPTPPVTQTPRMPRRPARPLSLRLSAVPKRSGLTTSRVHVVQDADRQTISESYSTQPHTGYTTAASKKGAPVKYGRGRYATTELVPQPSDDPQDPLNWHTWRKHLHFYALLTTVAMCNVMKTALVTANRPLADGLSASYTAAAALTGVPLMMSACTGLASSAAAKIWGRRPVFLASAVLLFIGVVWNTTVKTSYGQFMAARIFQGLGWGAFDTIVIGSIMDTYFEHERNIKIATYRIVSVATTWGAPLLGGLVVQNPLGVNLEFEVLAFFQLVSIPLLVLGAPETMYDREAFHLFGRPTPGWTPRTGWSSIGLKSSRRFRRLPAWARGRRGITLGRAAQYVRDVAPPASYRGGAGAAVDPALLLPALRAAVAPTTVLALLGSCLPSALLWGLVASLSGLLARAPHDLAPATVGSLLATPFLLATLAAAAFALWPAWSAPAGRALRARSTHPLVLGAGAALSLAGALAFGLHATTPARPDQPPHRPGHGLPALSLALGLLAAGAAVLDAPAWPLVQRAAPGLRRAADMDAGAAAWRALLAGALAVGVPAAVASDAGLRGAAVGVGVAQGLVAAGVAAVWWRWEDGVRRLDRRVLACADPAAPVRSPRGSFFETDD